MITILEKQNCYGCFACFNICPQNCISMKDDEEGFLYPNVDKTKCIECDLCEKVCPITKNAQNNSETIVYACKNKNLNIRMESSSGGIFTLLSENTLNKGGVVFGACFNEKLEVIHSFTETIDGLAKFRGPKYVQSQIGGSYHKAKEFLKRGKEVLFSGTPCQIAGLKSFLNKDYDNLICVDVVCHGVPSPFVFKKYLDNIEKKYDDKVMSFNFKDKKDGWKKYRNTTKYKTGRVVSQYGYESLFMKGFLDDIYIRPACFNCHNKYPNYSSDITLGDYWGIQTKYPEFDDDKGVSLVLVHSKSGLEIFKLLSNKMEFIKSDLEHASKYNPCVVRSVKAHKNRKKFFKQLNENELSIETIIRKYTKVSYLNRVKAKLHRIKSTLIE